LNGDHLRLERFLFGKNPLGPDDEPFTLLMARRSILFGGNRFQQIAPALTYGGRCVGVGARRPAAGGGH